AQRLSALLEKADPKAPALPRLKQTIANAQLAVAARAETEKTKEVTAAETKALEEQRLAQQAEHQRGPADARAAQPQHEATHRCRDQGAERAAQAATGRAAAGRRRRPGGAATAGRSACGGSRTR